MNVNDEFDYFETKNLYLVYVAPVRGTMGINNKIVLNEDNGFYTIITYNDIDEEYIDVFTGYVYLLSSDLDSKPIWFKLDKVGSYCITKKELLAKYLDKPHKNMSIKELENLYARFNSKPLEVNDLILNTILNLNYKIISSSLKSNDKVIALEMLTRITNEYTQALLEYRNGTCSSNNDYDEIKIRVSFAKKLINFEKDFGLLELNQDEANKLSEDIIAVLKLSQIRLGEIRDPKKGI
ncbi:MAG: hypothetical protein PUA90_05670 [bacterium]|nr:hypothetical protein [bacterium]